MVSRRRENTFSDCIAFLIVYDCLIIHLKLLLTQTELSEKFETITNKISFLCVKLSLISDNHSSFQNHHMNCIMTLLHKEARAVNFLRAPSVFLRSPVWVKNFLLGLVRLKSACMKVSLYMRKLQEQLETLVKKLSGRDRIFLKCFKCFSHGFHMKNFGSVGKFTDEINVDTEQRPFLNFTIPRAIHHSCRCGSSLP